MIALDGDSGNASLLQMLQRLLRLHQRQRVYRASVEEIACNYNEFCVTGDGVVNDIKKRAREVVEAVFQPVLLIAQVIISGVNKCCAHDEVLKYLWGQPRMIKKAGTPIVSHRPPPKRKL